MVIHIADLKEVSAPMPGGKREIHFECHWSMPFLHENKITLIENPDQSLNLKEHKAEIEELAHSGITKYIGNNLELRREIQQAIQDEIQHIQHWIPCVEKQLKYNQDRLEELQQWQP